LFWCLLCVSACAYYWCDVLILIWCFMFNVIFVISTNSWVCVVKIVSACQTLLFWILWQYCYSCFLFFSHPANGSSKDTPITIDASTPPVVAYQSRIGDKYSKKKVSVSAFTGTANKM
jgi:hypothetical protein